MTVIQSVGIVILQDGQVLLVRHKAAATHHTGVYGLPSGKLNDGETRIQAAVRELQEETGLMAKEENLIQLPTIYHATIDSKTGPRTFDWVVFICKRYEGDLKDGEETTPLWVEVKGIKKLDMLPNVSNAIGEALSM